MSGTPYVRYTLCQAHLMSGTPYDRHILCQAHLMSGRPHRESASLEIIMLLVGGL